MSFHEPSSDIGRLNREAGARPVVVDRWTFRVLAAALDFHRHSGGAFDVTVAPVLQAIGLLPRHDSNAEAAGAVGAAAVADVIALLPGNRVRFAHRRVCIDVGGIAKGFAVDRAIETLRAFGIDGGLVNAGGDLAAFGPAAETAAIRDPRDPRRLLCRVVVDNAALASSGGRFDPLQSAEVMCPAVVAPRAQQPTQNILGATVRAPTCMVADALTKAVMIAGDAASALLDRHGADALMVLRNGDVFVTAGWQSAIRHAA